MRLPRLLLLLLPLFCALGLASAPPARAVPMMAPLDRVITSSTTVIIAKVHGATSSGVELDVERALRGRATGAFLVKTPTAGALPYAVGTRLVAFVDAGGTWNDAGLLAVGPTLEDGVIHVEGLPVCCDANVVLPGVLTFKQLEDALKGTPLSWAFRGKLVLAAPGGPAPSTIEVLATTSSPSSGVGTVSGMPRMVAFPTPTVVPGSFDRDVTVTWNSTLARPLRIAGKAVGKNVDGSIAVEYRLEEPGALTEPEFRRYLGDATLSYPYYVLDVALTGGTKMTLTLGKDVGRVGELQTPTGTFPISGLSTAPTRAITTGQGTLVLDPRPVGFVPIRSGAEGELIQELLTGPIGCHWETSAAAPVACKLTLAATKFVSK